MASNNSTISGINFTNEMLYQDKDSAKLIAQYTENIAVGNTVYIPLLLMYVLLITVGTFGNSLVVLTVLKTSSMRTPRNLFILNLAISDLLLCTVTMPFTFMELVMKYWTLGEIMCKLVASLRATSIFVSTFSITAISLDRYYIIVHPTKQSLNIRGVVLCLLGIWVAAILLSTPLFLYTTLEILPLPPSLLQLTSIKYIAFCIEKWPIAQGRFHYSICAVIVQYLIPIIIVSIAYSKIYCRLRKRNQIKDKNRDKNKKTTILLSSIAVIFCISWLPLNTLNIYLDVYNPFDDETLVVVFGACHLIGMSSACSNPLLYGWLNDNFKKEFLKICFCFKLKKDSPPSRKSQYGRMKNTNIELDVTRAANGNITSNRTITTHIQ